MENREVGEAAGGEARPLSRALKAVILLGFGIPFVVHLLFGRWVTAAFFVASAVFALKGREIERWPKPRLVAAVVVYLAFGAAMLFELYWQLRPILWPAR